MWNIIFNCKMKYQLKKKKKKLNLYVNLSIAVPRMRSQQVVQ